MSENIYSEYIDDKIAKPSVSNLVNLMNKTAKISSSRSSSPTSTSSKNDLNDNKRTLSSSSLASSVSVSSSSNLYKNNNQTSDYVEDSSIGVFDESTGSKCLNKLNQVCRSNRSSISTSTTNNLDDFNDDNLLMLNYNDDSAVTNFTKLKAKKEDNEFYTMINKCQNWIETVTNKKFAYTNDFRKSLENGVILCELLNVLKPDCIRRINRHSTPIAGIDNLNQFLKACQEHFGLSQANLFDITDLEDLVKRRGTVSNNYSNKNENPNLNYLSIDEEQQRRLKKVVQTVSWLCQKANKSGIPLPFNLDTCNFHAAQPSAANLKPKNNIVSYSSNTSLSQFSSSSVSSSLSSSSSFIQSTNSSGVSLSVIIGPGDSIKLSTPKSNCPLKQRNERKETICSSSSSCSDEISNYKLECIEYCGQKLERKQTSMSAKANNLKFDYESNQLVSSVSAVQSGDQMKQEELQLIDSQCSPITNAQTTMSPRYVNTNTGRVTPSIPTPTSNTATIATRFFDRRFSNTSKEANPYKFNVNYSAAGQQLAKKAHEQLKTVEKSKELCSEKSDVTTVPRRKSDYINHDDESLNDDWQDKVDDWKKRRREKQKLPQKPRCYEEELANNRNERSKRINPFENSQHYILPLAQENSNEHKSCAMTIEVSTKKPTDVKNEEPDRSINESQSEELDESQNQQYIYIETTVDIDRPHDYQSRGFGFLLNSGLSNKNLESIQLMVNNEIVLVDKCYAQIVVVEPNTLADKAGLKKGDLVTEINESCTNNLNNEQLRKLMRQRLLANSISMKVLSQQRQGQEFENLSGVKAETRSHSELPTALSPSSSDHSTPTISSITSNPLLSQHKQADYHQIVAPKPFKKAYSTSIQTEDMNAESLIEKRKNQLNFILKWTLNSNTVLAESISPGSSNSSSIDDLAEKKNKIISSSLSDHQNSLDSLSEIKKSNETEVKSEECCDDTDHDNDDDDLLHSPSPPPVPTTEPPPLPSNKTEHPTLQIKKALLDNMKSIESWKQEQEELMKRKYEEEQKRIELSLKLDLNRVKEEEIQRREQERLKLEKEKIRLQELEIKQREEELKKNLDETRIRLTSPASNDSSEQRTALSNSPTQETIRKEDLNALIEKIYTEENQEAEFPKIEFHKPEPFKPARPNPPQKIIPQSLIQAKTASLGMAISNHEAKNLLPSLIDTNTKHQVIKQVHDSMDFLKNELLNKNMNIYGHEVDSINQNRNQAIQKQDQIEQIRYEQETIKMEKHRIEQEKEKLRFEAEQLRKEREMMLISGPMVSPTINDPHDLNLFKTNLQADIRSNGNLIPTNRKHINVVNKNYDGGHKTFKVGHLKNSTNFDQKMRRSVPSLVSEPRFVNHAVAPMTLARKSTGPQRMITSRPSNSYQQISQSQKALNQTQNFHNSPNTIQAISLNQKCSGCSQTLGQGSAMWIEKLGLAFHLKCFRCSVCSVTLGNGKEGTDVRVSGANRLHCNNCFSNDLGIC